MKKMPSAQRCMESITKESRQLLNQIHGLSASDPKSVKDALVLLAKLRELASESLNALQHEYLVVRTREHLEQAYAKNTQWYWQHPQQSGPANEPDLRAVLNDKVMVSAEVSAAARPIGSIDTHMRKTLENLAKMEGRRLYVVRTESMKKRAMTKVSKAGDAIEVLIL